jgi:peptidoglycan/LPS O-acetylase OafA/YrhL
MRSDNIAYLPAVDHLRGIAALWIVLYHGVHLASYKMQFEQPFAFDHWMVASHPLSAIVLEGHAAVGLFMVLSGFILNYGAWGRQLDYIGFLRNRLLRIYPLAIFLLAVAAYSVPEQFSWGALLQTLFLGHNLPGALNIPPYTDMFWAISVEFQFYLIFPLLTKVLRQHGWRCAAWMILALIVFRAVAASFGANARDLSYLTIVGRLDQFLIGMLLGAWWKKRSSRGIDSYWFPLVVALWALTLWLFNRGGGWPSMAVWKILWPTVEGVLSALFIVSYFGVSAHLPGFLASVLRRLGLMSYSLYLVHTVAITLLLQVLLPKFGLAVSMYSVVLLMILPLTLSLAAVTHWGVERPFLSLRGRYLS